MCLRMAEHGAPLLPADGSCNPALPNGNIAKKNASFLEFYGKATYNFTDTFNMGIGGYYTDDWLNTGAEGFYGNIGMGLLTRYAVAGGGVSLTARNDGPELKLGIGYRFLMSDTRKTSVSIFAGIDRGEFSDYDLSSGSGSSSGSIARRESHTVGEIGATVSFF